MAHKLLPFEPAPKKAKRFHLSLPITGKFGLALYVGSREIFIGIGIGQVTQEVITRKRLVKAPKGKVKVWQFDR